MMTASPSITSSPTHQPLPVSHSSIDADIDLELPFVHEIAQRSLTIQAKRAVTIQNALVASQLHHFTIPEAQKRLQQIKRSEEDLLTFLTQHDVEEYLMAFYEFLYPLKPTETFRPIETVLRRIFMTFSQVGKNTGRELFIATLVLLPGDVERKFETAIELALFENTEERSGRMIRPTVLQEALHCLLLAIIAIFEQENVDTMSLISTNDVVVHCLRSTVARIFDHQTLDTITFDELWSCLKDLDHNMVVPWLKYIDTTQWPKSKRSNGAQSPMPISQHLSEESARIQVDWDEEEKGECEESHEVTEKEGNDGVSAKRTFKSDLTFIFSGVDGGTLSIASTAAETLFDIVKWTCWTRLTPKMMFESFLRHTEDGLLDEKTFLQVVEELLSQTTSNPPRKDGFSDLILDAFKPYVTSKLQHVDAIELAAGFSLFTWGSKSDKLAAAFHYFDIDGKGYLNSQQLWRFLRSILIMLLFVSPPSDSSIVRHGSIFELVDTGEQEILENITEGIHEDLSTEKRSDSQNFDHNITTQNWGEEFTFADFGAWYNSGGFKAISWLELLDLRKWAFVSKAFQVDLFDTTPLPSTFKLENSQSEDNWGNKVAKEDEALLHAHTQSNKESSTLPGIVLKHDIILEFELPVDIKIGGAKTGKRPFSALCLDNGDLLSYFELQRATKFNQLGLCRLLKVFAPFLAPPPSPSWGARSFVARMDKDTFDACIQDLLPSWAKKVLREAQLNKNLGSASDFTTEVYPALLSSLSRIYFAFNRAGTGKVDLKELVSAFSLFFAGSKSEKLAFAFRLFDVDRDGCLTRREMWRFLRSFLTLLLVLGNGCDLSAQALANIVDAASICITNKIFKDTRDTLDKTQSTGEKDLSRASFGQVEQSIPPALPAERNSMEMKTEPPGNDVISFDAFAEWYSMHGYNIIAWIELLDSKKWPDVPPNIRDAILKFTRRQNAVTEYMTQKVTRPYRESFPAMKKAQTHASFAENDEKKRASVSTDRTWSIHSENERDSSEAFDNDRVETSSKLSLDVSSEPTEPNRDSQALDIDLQSVAFQFHSEVDGKVMLQIRLKDVAIVFTISERLQLRSMSCDELLDRLKLHARSNQMTKQGYLMAVRSLVSSGSLVKEEQELLSFHMLRIFFIFESESIVDAEESSDSKQENRSSSLASISSVHLAQLLAGLSVFCGTSKGSKLSLLFRLFSHKEGFVHRRHLFDMFRSVLSVLFAFSAYAAGSTENSDEWNTSSIAAQYTSELVSKVFIQIKCKHLDHISLEEFASWYAAGGYISCPWLELLDLTKWPAAQAFNATRQQAPPVYAFDMSEENNILHFTESDISSYLTMLDTTKLPNVPLSEIFDAVLAYSTPIPCKNEDPSYSYTIEEDVMKLSISRKRFYECVRSLIPSKPDSDKAQQLASKLLSRIFNSFDRKRVNQVSAMELACGLSILGKGSKSHKLEFAFEFVANMMHRGPNPAFETDGDDTRSNRAIQRIYGKGPRSLSQSTLFLFLRSFLLSLMSLSDVTYRLRMERMYIEADEFIEEVLGDFLHDGHGAEANLSPAFISRTRSRITFEQFGEWYNKGGYQLISWVELLDVAKWEKQTPPEPKKTFKKTNEEAAPAISNIKTRNMALSIKPERLSSLKKRTHRVHVRQSDIALEPFKKSSTDQTRDSGNVPAYRPISSLSDSPLLVFAIAENAAELQFFTEDLLRLGSFLSETQLHRVSASDLIGRLQHQLEDLPCSDASNTSIECVTRAVEICCPVNSEREQSNASLRALSEEAIDLVYMLCEAFVHENGSKHSDGSRNGGKNVNVKWIISGMLLLCGGTMLQKLTCSSRLLSAPNSAEIATSDAAVCSDALQDSLTAFLMGLYGISCSFSGEVTRYSAQLGAQEVMKAFLSFEDSDNASETQSESKDEEETYEVNSMTRMVSLQDFDNWFRKTGIHSNSWLELVELRNWPAGVHRSG